MTDLPDKAENAITPVSPGMFRYWVITLESRRTLLLSKYFLVGELNLRGGLHLTPRSPGAGVGERCGCPPGDAIPPKSEHPLGSSAVKEGCCLIRGAIKAGKDAYVVSSVVHTMLGYHSNGHYR